MLLRRFEPRIDSAGPGEHRGGVGFIREYEMLADADFTYSGSNHSTRPKGVAGGLDAPTGSCTVNPESDDPDGLNTIERVPLSGGDRVRIERPGGAGYGDPSARDPDLVLADVQRGFVSVTDARERYRVEITELDEGYAVDRERTDRLRSD